MKIEADGFILRNWNADDAERLSTIANNRKIYDNLADAFPHPYSIEDAKKYISLVQDEQKLSKVFAIEVDGTVMGSIGAFLKEDIYRKNAQIAYYIAEECWGKGIMTNVVIALVKYLFENFDLNRVFAEPFARNTGSKRVLEKAGFRLEAVLKSNVIKNGVIEDSCIYSILKDDFKH